MGVYSPTIQINSTPAIEVTMVGAITYQEFINVLGVLVYKINKIFIESLTKRQINQPITYFIKEPVGQSYQEILTPKIDPYQYQASYELSNKGKFIILNGFSTLSLFIFEGESVTMINCTDEADLNDLLKSAQAVNNFKNIPDKLGNLGLYEQKKCP